MDKSVWLGFLRHVLTFGGGFAVASGFADAGMIEQGVGAAVTLVGLIWSAYDKKTGA